MRRDRILPGGIEILGAWHPRFEEILTDEALDFIATLHRKFEPERRRLLEVRATRRNAFRSGQRPELLAETLGVREAHWRIAPLPEALDCRRVEITGPAERKMLINALNSGADAYMADLEDSLTPTWVNLIQAQVNLRDAIRRTITYTSDTGKEYHLGEKTATLLIRPRGWHLTERHLLVDGERVSGGLFDFALALFHNAHEQLARGAGPYFYLPKLESRLEARLWNEIFLFAQSTLGLARGTIKATVLIETILAAFEMDEILFELREHSAGLNAGRWDYLFSAIKAFREDREFCLADRAAVTMEAPFMRAYALTLVRTCHRRGAPAIGGMSALIPIKNDSAANDRAIAGVRHDKARDARDGFDGGWVAHPGLVPIAMAEFARVLGDRKHQREFEPKEAFGPADLLDFKPQRPITEAGLRNNINVGIHYIGSWLRGIGCVPIYNLMEDAATAEIARSQVWQWLRSPKGALEDGRRVDAALVQRVIAEELVKVRATVEADAVEECKYVDAAEILATLVLSEDFIEFLTLPLYEALEGLPVSRQSTDSETQSA